MQGGDLCRATRDTRGRYRYADSRYEGRRIRSAVGACWRLGATAGLKSEEVAWLTIILGKEKWR